jgi:hypothetical protein
MEGKDETRLIMKPASPDDLATYNQGVATFGREAESGLAAYGEVTGNRQRPADTENGVRPGLYWLRTPDAQELVAFFPFAFDKAKKVPCSARK